PVTADSSASGSASRQRSQPANRPGSEGCLRGRAAGGSSCDARGRREARQDPRRARRRACKRHVHELEAGEPEHCRKNEPERVLRNRDRQPATDEHARDRAEQQPAEDVEVDVSRQPVGGTRDVEQHCRMEDLRSTTLCARSGKTTSSVSPKKTPLPTEVSPTTQPPNPGQDRRSAITVGELQSWSPLLRANETFGNETDRSEQQGCAEHLPHQVLHVVSVTLRQ